MGRKQAEKAIQLQIETMIYGNESLTQKMKPKAQSTQLKVMESHYQGEVLGSNHGNETCGWMDFRIAMDQQLLYCLQFSLFLDGSLLWLSCHCVTIVHAGRVGAYNLSL